MGVGAAAIVAAGAFAVVQLSGSDNNPEDPVREMLEAAERGDVLGVLEQLAPGERDAVRDGVVELVDELERLEVLENADLSALTGYDLSIEGLELASDVVGDGLAHVRVEAGTSRYEVRAKEFPLGDFVRDIVGDNLEDAETSGEDPLELNDPDFLTTVERDGRWYVSIAYTLAEVARTEAGVALDDLGEGITPAGADSPEDAVRAMVEAGAELDIERMISLLAPDEMGALQEYSALYLDDARDATEDVLSTWEIRLNDLSLSSETDGDESLVKVEELALEATDGETTVTIADGCVGVDFPGPPPGEEDYYYPQDIDLCPGDNPMDALTDTPFGFFFASPDIEPPQIGSGQPEGGIVAHQVDGKWYISPTRTGLHNLVAVARILDRQDLDEIRAYVEEVFASFESGFEESYEVESSFESESGVCAEFDETGIQRECDPNDLPTPSEEPTELTG